ncbi:unnamed protein product [Plutella xylostella]|uniref:(diamondback moth) hypothetical protein n=1 Tax=Plutella xylostella TaxID=51655 RepID=A0A8S4DQZ1_PLUXY|nr:unnamed protein product [Plutella xylostella]
MERSVNTRSSAFFIYPPPCGNSGSDGAGCDDEPNPCVNCCYTTYDSALLCCNSCLVSCLACVLCTCCCTAIEYDSCSE